MTISMISRAVSALDTPSSLLPFFVKDAFDVTGRTVMAQSEGGKHEAREKFIEEAGTSLFWIGGIPATRAVINQVVKNKIDPNIQFKRINSEGVQNYYANELTKTVKENGKDIVKSKFSKEDLKGIVLGGEKLVEIKGKLTAAGFIPNKTKGFYKKYHVGITAATVLINLAMLTVAIPQFNLWLSRKLISKEINGKKNHPNKNTSDSIGFGQNNKVDMADFINKSNSKKFQSQPSGKNPSFEGLKALFNVKDLFNFTKMAEGAQMNPVNEMLLLDYGISGSRVTITPRNKNERIENAIKEGGILFFFYFAADIIKDKLCKLSDKFLNVPIDLDYKIINSKDFVNKLKNPHDKENVLNFANIIDEPKTGSHLSKVGKKELKELTEEVKTLNEINVIKLIDQELSTATKGVKKEKLFKNFTLQMAQKEGLIDVEFDQGLNKWIRHSKKYIQTDKVSNLNQNLKNFYEKAFAEIKLSSGEKNIEKIISKTKKVKIASIFGNMAICCASLSFILPKIQYIIREHRTKTTEAPGIKVYQEMAEKNMI